MNKRRRFKAKQRRRIGRLLRLVCATKADYAARRRALRELWRLDWC